MPNFSTKMTTAQESRAWITVIVAILLAEVGMHELGHISLGWGLVLASIAFAAGAVALRSYLRLRSVAWLIVTPLLVLIGLTLLVEALGLRPLSGVDLEGLIILGTEGPDHGLLAITHLMSDLAVIGIGVHQLFRWIRLRNTGSALGAAAAFTACCGTTAVLLAPAFAALSSLLAAFGIHLGLSNVIVATILTLAVALLGYAFAERMPFNRNRKMEMNK
jgi:hypothetical protein